MDYIRMLLEKREELKQNAAPSFRCGQDLEMFYAFNAKGDMVVSGMEQACVTEEGKLLSEFYSDGSQREEVPQKRQMIHLLYLIPDRLTLEEYDQNPYRVKDRIPLPSGCRVRQIVCSDEIFTVSFEGEKPDIFGAFTVMLQELSAAEYSYYGKNGLTEDALERYYYEFLPEGHERYLREEERKNLRKPPKKLENKKIKPEDFQDEGEGEYECECEILLWGKRACVYASYDEEPGDEEPGQEDEGLEEFIRQLNQHLKWIEENRAKIQEAILDDGMVELANNWMEGFETEGEDGERCYETDEGELIPCPITEEAFLEALSIGGMNVHYRKPLREPCNQIDGAKTRLLSEMVFDMFLNTEPDFFACHDIEVFITAMADGSYEIKVNGLAG